MERLWAHLISTYSPHTESSHHDTCAFYAGFRQNWFLLTHSINKIPWQRQLTWQYVSKMSFLGVLLCSLLTPVSEAPLPTSSYNILQIFRRAYYLIIGDLLSSVIVKTLWWTFSCSPSILFWWPYYITISLGSSQPEVLPPKRVYLHVIKIFVHVVALYHCKQV